MRKPHTFDIFDTLIARRCVEPKNIFVEMEEQLKVPGFAKMRLTAERNIASSEYDFDDIYQELIKTFGVDPQAAEYLQAQEVEYELKNVIGIRENLEKIQDGDILITDMYLPRAVILKLLKKAGLNKQVGLIISNGGKSTGEVWKQLNAKIEVDQHLGDNLESDVKSAMKNGIYANHFSASQFSAEEVNFLHDGLGQLARILRELRLRSISSNTSNQANEQILLQINRNIPILLILSVRLKQACKDKNINKLLFSSRDCFYLSELFQILNDRCGWKIPSEYFYTSRSCRFNPSEDYVQYVKSISDADTMIVDLNGTGQSLIALYDSIGEPRHTFLLHDFWTRFFDKNARRFDDKFLSIIQNPNLRNDLLELLNYVDVGRTLDVKVMENCRAMVPIFEHPGYPQHLLKTIERIRNTQQLLRDVMSSMDLSLLVFEMERNPQTTDLLIKKLYRDLPQSLSCMNDLLEYHRKHDHKSSWPSN